MSAEACFIQLGQVQTSTRAAVTAAYRTPETACVAALLPHARLPPAVKEASTAAAARLVTAVRAKSLAGGLHGLLREYALSTQEGVALMCLAEALLRIPDAASRDALIRDKIGAGNWHAHLGHSDAFFINAATWALMLTGKLAAAQDENGLTAALTRVIAAGGERVIGQCVALAVHLIGAHFVTGQTIAEAMHRARPFEARGFRYSYDMLGEAAVTAEEADRYCTSYKQAIHTIGATRREPDTDANAGISIKLSALHPRYERAQRARVMAELIPRVRRLAILARGYGIGMTVDAEETDRLDLSLDVLDALCGDADLAGWNGIGFVVQTYQKRAARLVDHLIQLSRASRHRLMVRLVKGAYWDTEIKRAQVDGMDDFPVFTRKAHTDISYIACARQLLSNCDSVYPQFATHNALTIGTILSIASPGARYEFQCLHGMGEALYEEVVGADKLNRPCRIYAPVGAHSALLPYLVRRLLENGANTSFVNRLSDPGVDLETLLADPVHVAEQDDHPGAPHPGIVSPANLYAPERRNARGFDFSNEADLATLGAALAAEARGRPVAQPALAKEHVNRLAREICNPADRRDIVGAVVHATETDVAVALAASEAAWPAWSARAPQDRAECLQRAADLMENGRARLVALLVREAGKTLPDAMAELREAIDFLRYYAAQVAGHFSNRTHKPLGIVACISPWNFPLAIFTGQIAASLAAGNAVIAKCAEETPLVASCTVRLLHEAGVPAPVLQFLPGDADIGACLVAETRVAGVVFTGSLGAARAIQRSLAQRLGADGKPVPLIAETGGRNAMIVDSTARPEQAVADIIRSAFNSAGQRCSALRLLCVQEDVADTLLTQLRGGIAELAIGSPALLSTDVGPVITVDAKQEIDRHVQAMRAAGHSVFALSLPDMCRFGSFVAPALIEIQHPSDVPCEVFGPVLHVLRYHRAALDDLITEINAGGYALTFGLQTRVDRIIRHVVPRIEAGNIYVNRNMIGAVVGVQPFGGYGLSGTGPKAGGPLYVRRLLAARPDITALPMTGRALPQAQHWADWLEAIRRPREAARCGSYIRRSLLETDLVLPGPVGESNRYSLAARGRVLCIAQTAFGLAVQIGAVLATGNRAVVDEAAMHMIPPIPDDFAGWVDAASAMADVAAVLFEGSADTLRQVNGMMAQRDGAIVLLQAVAPEALESGADDYVLEWLYRERAVSTNTAAIGGVPHLSEIA